MDGGGLKAKGRYHVEHWRDGELLSKEDVSNLIVNQGLDHILAVEFAQGQQVTQWYLAPYTNNYVPVAGDTAQSIVNVSGEATGYSGGSRQPYVAVEGQQQVTNAAQAATFSFTASLTIYGAFLISSQGQQSTQGTLFSAAQFSTPKSVVNGDQLVLTYSFAAGSA